MKQPVLGEPEVIAALADEAGPRWHLIGGKLIKTVVCDGFVGNVVLKVAEGLAKMIGGALRDGNGTALTARR